MSFVLENHGGEKLTEKEFLELPEVKEDSENSLVFSDMDGTMYTTKRKAPGDIGRRVFLEELGDPYFWHFGKDQFSRILLPRKYYDLLEDGAAGAVGYLDPTDCISTLLDWSGIVNLYSEIIRRKNEEGNGLGLEHPLMNEFARRMVAFDEFFKENDGTIEEDFLMRTRFLRGRNRSDVIRLTEAVMERSEEEKVLLRVFGKNKQIVGHEIKEGRLRPLSVDRGVCPVEKVQELIKLLVTNLLYDAGVVTTNLRQIAITALSMTPEYKDLIKESLIFGSLLKKKNGRYQTMLRVPVIGVEKREAIKEMEKKSGKTAKIAFGDSPSGDGPMLIHVLSQGGVAVAVGPTIEQVRQKFAEFAERAKAAGVKNFDERMFYTNY